MYVLKLILVKKKIIKFLSTVIYNKSHTSVNFFDIFSSGGSMNFTYIYILHYVISSD